MTLVAGQGYRAWKTVSEGYHWHWMRCVRCATARLTRCDDPLQCQHEYRVSVSKQAPFLPHSFSRPAVTTMNDPPPRSHVNDTHITHSLISSFSIVQWSEGDEVPTSWREFYQNNPCVPIDYPNIPAALATAESPLLGDVNRLNPALVEQRRSIRILLRPGDYILREAILIQASEDVQVTIETMRGGPFTVNHQVAEEERYTTELSSSSSSSPKWARKAASIRNRLTCRGTNDVDMELEPPEEQQRLSSSRPCVDRASLILRTRRHNEPLVRVRQGSVKLVNLELLHNSHGTDIWNGNAAVQIQPDTTSSTSLAAPRPTAWMESVEVISHSGRGIVNIDGGFSVIQNCYVHDCAATGIYVGGPGTQAVIDSTDVLMNGHGSRNRRGGIRAGHSGVYLEQGKATIRNCNISRNTLTGISAVSLDNAILDMEASDLVANGAAQLEMPRGRFLSPDSALQQLTRNNRMATIGFARHRSGLVNDGEE